LRLEDYRFYGRICQISGIVLICIGFALPVLTAYQQRYLYDIFPPEWRFPYLAHGIAVACLGIILFVASLILFREYRLRKTEQDVPTELPRPPE
jgi:hypothetical protein